MPKEKWSTKIQINRKQVYIGIFDSREEAAKAYDIAAIKLHGEFAILNFPESWR